MRAVAATAPTGTAAAAANMRADRHSFSRIVGLTHTRTPDFPTFSGDPQLELETLVTLANDGYNM